MSSSQKDAAEHVKKLTRVGIALSTVAELDDLFTIVLDEAIAFSGADAGSIYRVSDDGRFLDFQIVCTLSRGLHLSRADIRQWPSVALYIEDREPNLRNFVSYVYHTGQPLALADVYDQDVFDNSGTRKYDEANHYRSRSMVGIPLKNHENTVLGVIQLINAQDASGRIVSFTPDQVTVISSLASQAAIALSNRKLINDLEELLRQFIRVIARAIDRKSKYTGNHIARVAALTEMIASQIQENNALFGQITLSPAEMEELSIASWMHDLGKIVTPAEIMDKATKLEGLWDRLELVKSRFDTVEAILLMQLERPNLTSQQSSILKSGLQQLSADREFLSSINRGDFCMTDDDIVRIDEITSRKYRAGEREYCLLTPAEADCLKIRSGTLSGDDIHKMREHALITHEMLQQLSFPRKYSRVPEYAAAHHEKLNGSGYPFHKQAAELNLQARILAMADIFESLTASDRPYKKANTLHEALVILAERVKADELDGSLLDLILDSGLYREFGRRFLRPDQLNKIDIKQIKEIYHAE